MPANEPRGLGRQLATNTLHAAVGRVVSMLLWLVLTPPLYRALGVEGFAVWSLFFALTGWLTSLDLGLAPGTLRHVAAARARGDHVAAGEFATVSVLGYLALGALWLALAPLLRDPVIAFLRVPDVARASAEFAFTAGAVVFALAGIANTTIAVLQGCDRFDLANGVTLALALGQGAGLVLVLARGAGVPGVVLATGLGWTVAALAGALSIRAGAPEFRWASPLRSLGRFAETMRFGLPMQFGNVFAVAHQQIDKVLLARFVLLAAVTPYELGLRLATAASTIPQLLMLALIPAATALHAGGDAPRFAELHRRANRYILVAAVVVTAGVLAGAGRLFGAWLGHDDASATLALRGLMAASALGVGAGMATVSARAIGRTDLEAEFSIVAFVVHLALGLWMVRAYHLAGAVGALAIGNAVGAAWFLVRLARTLGWPLARTILAPLGLPLLGLALGLLAGAGLDRVLAHPLGLAAWPGAILVSAAAAAVTAGVALASRYVTAAEMLALLRPGRRGA